MSDPTELPEIADAPRFGTSAPDPLIEFDHLLTNEDQVEKYVSLGLGLEELLEKLRTKGLDAEKQTLSRLLELSQARAQLLELAAKHLLDGQKQRWEQAFVLDPHNMIQPFRSVLNENRDDLIRLVQSALTRDQAPTGLSSAAQFGIGFLLSLVVLGGALVVLQQIGVLDLHFR